MVGRFNLLQSFNYTPYLFLQKTLQIRYQFSLYMDPFKCNLQPASLLLPGFKMEKDKNKFLMMLVSASGKLSHHLEFKS
jgi:hypothetical protein